MRTTLGEGRVKRPKCVYTDLYGRLVEFVRISYVGYEICREKGSAPISYPSYVNSVKSSQRPVLLASQ